MQTSSMTLNRLLGVQQMEWSLYDHFSWALSTHSLLRLILYRVYKIILPVTINLMYELDQRDKQK